MYMKLIKFFDFKTFLNFISKIKSISEMKSALKKKPILEKKTKKIQKAKVPKKTLKPAEAPEIVQKAPRKLKMNRLALSKKTKEDVFLFIV